MRFPSSPITLAFARLRTDYSSRGYRFNSQHSHGVLEPTMSPVPGDLVSLPGSLRALTMRGNTHCPPPFPTLQSLAMLKDGFRTDRGSHSDLWSSSSSLESSSFPMPKQFLDVSSQTDISGSVSGPGWHLGGCSRRMAAYS